MFTLAEKLPKHRGWLKTQPEGLSFEAKTPRLLANVFWRRKPTPGLGFHTLRPRQNGRRFADDTFKRIFLNENVTISIKISLKFVPKGPLNNNPALVLIMAWRRSGDKPLSEPMMVSLPTHICVIRPQWVNQAQYSMTEARHSNPKHYSYALLSITNAFDSANPEQYLSCFRELIQPHFQYTNDGFIGELSTNISRE